MADKLQHSLSNMEITPPSGSWDIISKRLDAEYNATEISLAQKFLALEIEPPSSLFPFIVLEINPPVETNLPAESENTGLWRKISIAALVIGIIGLSALLLIQGNPVVEVVPQAVIPQKHTDTETIAVIPTIPSPKPEVTTVYAAGYSSPRRTVKKSEPASPAPIERESYDSYVTYADMEGTESVIPQTEIAVEAPLIRDANGRIVMDRSLLAPGDDNYIKVTSPNGEQTKISRKFLNLLHYLNSPGYYSEASNDGLEWRMKFEDWRNRLLQQAAYVPSATNFMDIFELKDLIQDK